MFLTLEELPIRRFYSQSLELFRGKYFYRKVNRDPKITASKGFPYGPPIQQTLPRSLELSFFCLARGSTISHSTQNKHLGLLIFFLEW
jgi:hypothetical protein